MPIRINLLAEAHAAEELRRRDPVKRAIWGAALSLALMLAWSSFLYLKGMIALSELNRIDAQLSAQTNSYQHVISNQARIGETAAKLTRLQQLTTNRFLVGTLLNALQQTTIDDVQLIRFRALEDYVVTPAVAAKTEDGRTTPAKPATSTEKIGLVLEAQDNSAAGDGMNRFRQAISTNAFCRATRANDARLLSLAPPQAGADGKTFTRFALECRFPEKTR